MEEPLIRLLHAVVGKRMAGDLPSGEPAPIGKRGQVKCVDHPPILEKVQDFVRAFIHKGDGADLDAIRRATARPLRGFENAYS